MADNKRSWCHTRRMWQRLRDSIITGRTRRLIAERECRHDDTPLCRRCVDADSRW